MTSRRWIVLYTRPGRDVWHASDVFECYGETTEFVRQAKSDGSLVRRVIQISTQPLPRPPEDVTEATIRNAGWARLPSWIGDDKQTGRDIIPPDSLEWRR